MVAQHIVREGVRWQVRNGRNIGIWSDKWLPSPSTFRIISLANISEDQAHVCELINSEDGGWNSGLVR